MKIIFFLRVWNYFWGYEKVSFGYEENPIFAKKYFHTLGYENIGCFFLMPPCPCPAQRGTPAPATVRPWGRWCPSAHNVSRPHLQLCTRAERSAYPRKLLVLPPQSQQHGLGRCRLSCNCMDMLVLQVTTAPRRQARGGHVACTPAAGRVRDLSTEVRRIFFLKNLCYEVFAKQKKTEESSNNYF
jgi:hypothetical protein